MNTVEHLIYSAIVKGQVIGKSESMISGFILETPEMNLVRVELGNFRDKDVNKIENGNYMEAKGEVHFINGHWVFVPKDAHIFNKRRGVDKKELFWIVV